MNVLDYEIDFILDPSLSLYLPLWKKDGASFRSDDHYGHLCTKIGALWRPQGHYFDGTDDYIDIGEAFESTIQSTHKTLMGWCKPALTNYATNARFASLARTGTSTAFSLLVDGGGSYGVHDCWVGTYIRANTIFATVASSVSVTTEWTHVALVQDGSDVYIYINGVLANTKSNASATTTSSPPSMFIAAYNINGSASQLFKGNIGQVLLHDRSLSGLQVRNHCEATKWRYQ